MELTAHTTATTRTTGTTRTPVRTSGATAAGATGTVRAPRRTGVQDADGMAVASFVLGLLGLLVLNVFLGPVAIVLASIALWRGTARRGRAFLGLGLGIADLVVLVTFMQVDNTVSWSF
ncbi:DUF4190 domain-containing protein [Streptomyces sp. NPDC058751]|uniref:DUF4190 domain-containing protein n=1 Tax=Streptomyces sp. NPDC058751 TaxID=3346623 RepID=UPI0036899A43